MTEMESKVVAAWHQAAVDLGIQFTSPFSVSLPDGQSVVFLGLVHKFGGRVGTLISVLGEPSSQQKFRADDDYFISKLGRSYGTYQRQHFIDTLDDWQFFGAQAERPAWYAGKRWA